MRNFWRWCRDSARVSLMIAPRKTMISGIRILKIAYHKACLRHAGLPAKPLPRRAQTCNEINTYRRLRTVSKHSFIYIKLCRYLLAVHFARGFVARTSFLCAASGGMPANNKKTAQKNARCWKCKNCVKYGTKKKCLNPKDQPQEQQAAAAPFSSPVTRRQSDAGRGSRRVR